MTYEFTGHELRDALQEAYHEIYAQHGVPGDLKAWVMLSDVERATYERMAALLNEKQQPQDFSMLIDAARDAVLRRYQAQDIDFATYEQVAGLLSNARTALLLALRQPTQGVLGEEETV